MKTIRKDDGSYHLDFSDELIPTDQVFRQVAEAIHADTEGKVKAALIALGWTPPKDPNHGEDE